MLDSHPDTNACELRVRRQPPPSLNPFDQGLTLDWLSRAREPGFTNLCIGGLVLQRGPRGRFTQSASFNVGRPSPLRSSFSMSIHAYGGVS
jgi:hypothetical protein